MTQADQTQTYHALMRCCAELRGISARLRDNDSAGAALVEGIAADVMNQWLLVRAGETAGAMEK